MRGIVAGFAALALMAGGAVAEPGGKGGKGGGGGGGGHAENSHASKGGRPDKSVGGPRDHGVRAEKGHPGQGKPDKFVGRSKEHGGPGGGSDRHASSDRGQGRHAERPMQHDKRVKHDTRVQHDTRGNAHSQRDKSVKNARQVDVVADDVRDHVVTRDDRIYRTADRSSRFALEGRPFGLVEGCPPGLAKKYNGCMPPGLAKKRIGLRNVLSRPAWWGLGGLGAGQYFYDDGYLMRYGNDGVSGWLPLLGGALAPGRPWPSNYGPVALPGYYSDFYELGPSYRYYDDVLYRVDPETSTISSIAALLTGDRWNVGDRLPLGYDVYNVPYDYRGQYVDGPDAWYRYNDGYIYQVDPKTQLVAAVIQLLT